MTSVRVPPERAREMIKVLTREMPATYNGSTWKYLGPNCTTTAQKFLIRSGVPAPAWAVTPRLIHVGTRHGYEITAGAGGAASLLDEGSGVFEVEEEP